MEVYSSQVPSVASERWIPHIARLIEVTGTPRFESELFQAASELMGCDHLTAFASSGASLPRVLLAANKGTLPIAQATARRYLSQFWHYDQANNIEMTGSTLCLRMRSDEVQHSQYRQECYLAIGLQDRLSILQRRHGEAIRLNFYRGRSNLPWAEGDIERVMRFADVLISLLVKNASAQSWPAASCAEELFRSRLRLLDPDMPRREIDVCAGIVSGRTSEAIAIDLGISINTVLTYRKRSYRRLNISAQNELMKLILS